MPVTREAAQGVTRDFIRDYPGALALAYYFREDTDGLYGSRAGQVPADFLGGYVSQPLEHAGRQYLGRVDVPLQNARSPEALRVTLQHEVLGHYGINTFAPAEHCCRASQMPACSPPWPRPGTTSTDAMPISPWPCAPKKSLHGSAKASAPRSTSMQPPP